MEEAWINIEALNAITLRKIPLKSWKFEANFELGFQQNQESEVRVGN